MAERPDYPGLIAGHADVVDMLNAGDAGLPALHRLLEVAQRALHADGMSFAEYGPHGGRVIAASGKSTWSLGRPVDRTHPAIDRLLSGPRSWNVPVTVLEEALASQLRGRGLFRMVGARAEVRGLLVGSIHAYFPDPDGVADPEEHTVIRYLASCAAHLYGDQAGLPGSVESRGVTFRDATEQHRVDHDRDLFVAVTSHELRTPVTVIKGFAETLVNHWVHLAEPDRQEAVRVIGQRAGELAKLVDRLLATASEPVPVGGAPPVPFDLAEGLRAAVSTLPATMRNRLVLEVPDDLPKALGDRAILPTVVTELVTNADKYSHVGSPIELTSDADPRTVFFRVSDRGVGVLPEHVERAFDRFWQGESGDRRRYPGAGLGLYLVRRIVERQNGWVSLRPREGGGTVAEVRLPRGDVGLTGWDAGDADLRGT